MTMAKKKTQIARISSSSDGQTEIHPLGNDEIDELVKEKKSDRFFNFFKNEKDFSISVYKVGDRGKTSLCEKYENRVPDPLEDIRKVWGGGQYKLYAHNFAEPPELIDSCVINIEPLPPGFTPTMKDPDSLRRDLLQDIVQMKTLFAGDGGNEKIMLAMMDMQSKHSQELNRLIGDIQKASLENQLRMEQRFADMMKDTKPKSSLSEITEVLALVDEIRGGGAGNEQSMFEKVINNPLVQNVAAGLMTNPVSSGTHEPPKQIPAPVDIYAEIPDEFKAKVTRENYAKAVDLLTEKISNRDKAGEIIEKILREKGL